MNCLLTIAHLLILVIQFYSTQCKYMKWYYYHDGNSGVATGWRGWTMSRGPWANGAPKERPKKWRIEKKKKKKRKKK